MDNNLNNQPAQSISNTQIPTDNMQMDSKQNSSLDKKGNSMVWIIVIILVVVVLGAGFYLYMKNQNSAVPTNTPVTTTSSTESSFNSLNNQLNSADSSTDNSDINQLDQDLQNL